MTRLCGSLRSTFGQPTLNLVAADAGMLEMKGSL